MCKWWGVRCPECDDQLIHLLNRGPHESSSPLGQWVHENLGPVFNVVDDDLCEPDFDVHARSTHILRRIEHKFPGRGLSRSQRDVYPLYSEALHGLAARGRIDERSGVFVVECDIPPVDGGAIERVQWNGALAERHHLDARELGWFLRGRPARSRDGVPV